MDEGAVTNANCWRAFFSKVSFNANAVDVVAWSPSRVKTSVQSFCTDVRHCSIDKVLVDAAAAAVSARWSSCAVWIAAAATAAARKTGAAASAPDRRAVVGKSWFARKNRTPNSVTTTPITITNVGFDAKKRTILVWSVEVLFPRRPRRPVCILLRLLTGCFRRCDAMLVILQRFYLFIIVVVSLLFLPFFLPSLAYSEMERWKESNGK